MILHRVLVIVCNVTYFLLLCVNSIKLLCTFLKINMSEENGNGSGNGNGKGVGGKDPQFDYQQTMDDRDEELSYQQTMPINPTGGDEPREPRRDTQDPSQSKSWKEGKEGTEGKEGKEGKEGTEWKEGAETSYKPNVSEGTEEKTASTDFYAYRLDDILVTNKNGYIKQLEEYQKDPNCKIDPTLHLVGDEEEIENYIINEKIYTTTYIQYIDVYEGITTAEEGVEEEEEIEYVELPKYVTKYKPKIIIDTIEKTIEVPSGEEIKKPKYNNVDVPYIIPNLIENEILVVLKKIIQPQIEVTNEVIEVEVQKYIPKLIPVNVYVPRHFGISAKVKGVAEETIRFVDLTQEQIDALMKELNPHLEELKQFNENQLKRMDEYIKESQQQAKTYNFDIPEPLAVSYDEHGNCKDFEYSEFNKIKEAYISEMIH